MIHFDTYREHWAASSPLVHIRSFTVGGSVWENPSRNRRTTSTPHRKASKPQPSSSESVGAGWWSPQPQRVAVGDINLHLGEKKPPETGSTGLVLCCSLLLASPWCSSILCLFPLISTTLLIFSFPVVSVRCLSAPALWILPSFCLSFTAFAGRSLYCSFIALHNTS